MLYIHYLGLGNGILEMTPEAQATKEKTHKLDFMEIRKFCASKDTVKKVERRGFPGGTVV